MSYTQRSLPSDHPPLAPARQSILLVNLGTPDTPTPRDVRRYLSEFLSDRRVVELSPLLWQPLLQGPILTARSPKTAALYRTVWDEAQNDSPLRLITRAQAEQLSQFFSQNLLDKKNKSNGDQFPPEITVHWAMRYGKPSISDTIDRVMAEGCEHLVVFPLYPQYCAATTASVCDAVFRKMMRLRFQPSVSVVPPYHDHAMYIKALASSYHAHVKNMDFTPDGVLFSFHGMPRDTLLKGDPYHCHCQKTARLLREELGLSDEKAQISFQSRFGPAKWLEPYTEDVLKSLPGRGIKKLAVMTPGFAADCLETLEEIAMRGKETFEAAGGQAYTLVPCLNTQSQHIDLLAHLAKSQLHYTFEV